MKTIFKIDGYDEFKCIADKCKFTCCSGWDICVDEDTHKRYEEDGLKKIIDELTLNDEDMDGMYKINKETNEDCPFLDDKKLCSIVREYGDEYISYTCQSFPRIKNEASEGIEFSLSCSCPVVVDNIDRLKQGINVPNNTGEDDGVLRIRASLLNIIRKDSFKTKVKLILCYQMLLEIMENESFGEKYIIDVLEKYEDTEYLKVLISMLEENKPDAAESLEEMINLFEDITEYYEQVNVLKDSLEEISRLAEEIEERDLNKYDEFNDGFRTYDNLLENCIASKIFSSCISDDIVDNIIAFEMIILEYALVNYSMFIKYCSTGVIDNQDLKDYIVVFSRIIGNNQEAVLDFIVDGFDSEILEMGYVMLIL